LNYEEVQFIFNTYFFHLKENKTYGSKEKEADVMHVPHTKSGQSKSGARFFSFMALIYG
jgi:hypothetical protein